jgi:hypothetical protein
VSIIVKQETNIVRLAQSWGPETGYGMPGQFQRFPGAILGGQGQPLRTSPQPPPSMTREQVESLIERRRQELERQNEPNVSRAASVPDKPEKTLTTFRLKEVVYAANVLRASSDPTRVRVTRREGGNMKEWVFDLNRLATANEWNIQAVQSQGRLLPPWEDLWLRDGDVIEIPEKQ